SLICNQSLLPFAVILGEADRPIRDMSINGKRTLYICARASGCLVLAAYNHVDFDIVVRIEVTSPPIPHPIYNPGSSSIDFRQQKSA
ncbi:11323_t:CDS:1, partial [Paraglomus occultum]